MSAPRTLYEILDVTPEASLPDVEAGYQRAMEVFSEGSLASYALFAPDEAERIRREIQVAFGVLSHPQSRSAYDAALAAASDKAQATLSFATTYELSNEVSISDSNVPGTPVRPPSVVELAPPLPPPAPLPELPVAAPEPALEPPAAVQAAPEPPPRSPPLPVSAVLTPLPPVVSSPPLPVTPVALPVSAPPPPAPVHVPITTPPTVAVAAPLPGALPIASSPVLAPVSTPVPLAPSAEASAPPRPVPVLVIAPAVEDVLPPPGPAVENPPPARQVLSDLPPLPPLGPAVDSPPPGAPAPSWVPVTLSTELPPVAPPPAPVSPALPTTPPLPVVATTPLPGTSPGPFPGSSTPAGPPPSPAASTPPPPTGTAPVSALPPAVPPASTPPTASSPPARFKRVRLDDGQSSAQASRAAPPPAVSSAKAGESIMELPEKGEITGSLLQQLREARGLDLKTMAEVTKVSIHYLRAIESNQVGELPSRVYLRGFLLQYARALRIPSERVAAGYLAFAERYYRSQIR